MAHYSIATSLVKTNQPSVEYRQKDTTSQDSKNGTVSEGLDFELVMQEENSKLQVQPSQTQEKNDSHVQGSDDSANEIISMDKEESSPTPSPAIVDTKIINRSTTASAEDEVYSVLPKQLKELSTPEQDTSSLPYRGQLTQSTTADSHIHPVTATVLPGPKLQTAHPQSPSNVKSTGSIDQKNETVTQVQPQVVSTQITQDPQHKFAEEIPLRRPDVGTDAVVGERKTSVPIGQSSENSTKLAHPVIAMMEQPTNRARLNKNEGEVEVPRGTSDSNAQPPDGTPKLDNTIVKYSGGMGAQTPAVSVIQAQMADLESKRSGDRQMRLDGETTQYLSELKTAGLQTNASVPITTPNANTTSLAQQISTQIQEAVRAANTRSVEISLNPKELGRVQMSIAASEGGVTLQILAEKPETLDLMRRHVDLLEQDFIGLGFTSIDLSFGKGTDRNTSSDSEQSRISDQSHSEPDRDDTVVVQAPKTIHLDGAGSLDIRI